MDARPIAPLGRAVAAAVLLGCLLATRLPVLPASSFAIALCVLGVWGWSRKGIPRLLGAAAAGLGWCLVHMHASMALRIEPSLQDRPLRVIGHVVGLPEVLPDRQRFEFVAVAAWLDGRPLTLRGGLRLSRWRDPVAVAAGEHLEMIVVLRRPRGLRNPGGFDFERLALERRYAATGSVREILSRHPGKFSADQRRAALAARITAAVADEPAADFLRALAVGDQAAVPDFLWEVFRTTGTTHLVAISGFHIGMVGAFVGLLGGLAHRLTPGAGWWVPRRVLMAMCALAGASAYSFLAGWSLPVQRTLAMLAAVLLAVMLRRPLSAGRALASAALVVLGVDPLAVLNAGFWLSFAGVFWLLFALDGRARVVWWRGYAHAQWAAFIALLPLGAAWFQQASLVAPWVNLLAIPWVSFVLVPLLLLGLAFGPAGDCLLHAVGILARWYLDGLAWAASLPMAAVDLPVPTTASLLLALLGTAIVLLPRAIAGRSLGLVFCLPLLWPRIAAPPPGSADVVVLDVGQGSAVLVKTARHALLYDAGPARGVEFDAGQLIVLPALRALGVRRLDRLVISHGDHDHSGGADAVRRRYPDALVETGPGTGFGLPCTAGTQWTWDGVDFRFLHPPAHFPALGNESSCVLRIAVGAHATLLPGDIGAVIEQRLAREVTNLRADLLLLAHHGSKSGSTAAFLAAVKPLIAVASAGYRNRFGHPAPEVVNRLRQFGATVHGTADSGALHYRLDARGVRVVSKQRRNHQRPWQEGGR